MSDTTARAAHRDNRHDFPRSDWWVPYLGARLPRGHDSLGDRLDAVMLVAPPSTVVVGSTAALLWGIPVPERVERGPVHVNLPVKGFHIDRAEVLCHRRQITSHEVTDRDGLRVTVPVRTLLDLGTELDTPALVAAADYILRHELATLPELVDAAERCRRRRGIVKVREALRYADPGAESPQESVMRYHLWSAGMTDLLPNRDIRDDRGRFLARGDLVDDRAKIVVEYDGLHHLTRETQLTDAERRLAVNLSGWFIVTVVAHDLREPHRVIAKVRSAYSTRRPPR